MNIARTFSKTLCLAIVIAALLSACGGGGGGSSPSPVSQLQSKSVTVSLYGDSTMKGTERINGVYVVTNVLAGDLQSNLQAALGPNVTVIQNAQFGTTLADLLNGTNGFQSLAEHLKTDTSPIFVENFGLNDLMAYPVDQFKANLSQYITMVQAAGKIVVLEEPNPNCVMGTTTDQEYIYPNGSTISQAVQVINDLGAQYGINVIHQYDKIKAMPNFCGLMSDTAEHPTAALYEIKAGDQAAILTPIIRQLQGL